MLADRFRWCDTIDIKAVCLRPAPGIAPQAFSIKDFLRRRDHLVARVPAGIRGIGGAARLDTLHFR
ncbi:hypothetical protein A5686_01760 [Mycobacterium sp. E2479]|nr:hypothetical protein A5686_01760 [Mycobacterium sp. E2479]